MKYEDVKVGDVCLLINDHKHHIVLKILEKEKERSRVKCLVLKSVEASSHQKGDIGFVFVPKLGQLSSLSEKEAVLEML